VAVIQVTAFAVVLAALPYPVFELDRYAFPKELVLSAGALAATLLCLASARHLTVFMVDALLAGFLVVSAVSALFATNGWLAFRALGMSLAGAALFLVCTRGGAGGARRRAARRPGGAPSSSARRWRRRTLGTPASASLTRRPAAPSATATSWRIWWRSACRCCSMS
jgi:hypothetical protein